MKDKYKKEQFEDLVKNSFSISEVCFKIGLNKSGGGHNTVKKYIEILNI